VEHVSKVNYRASFKMLQYITLVLTEYEKEANKAKDNISYTKNFIQEKELKWGILMTRINAKEIFTESILELIKKKSLQEITVTNIVEHSGLSRQSFYVHYRDKYDLVNQIYDDDINRAINDLQSFKIYIDIFIEVILEGMYDKLPFYVKALEYTGQNALMHHMKDVAYQTHAEIVLPHMNNKMPQQKIPYCLNYHANCAIITTIDWVINNTYVPPREVASMIVESIPRLMKPCYSFSKYC